MVVTSGSLWNKWQESPQFFYSSVDDDLSWLVAVATVAMAATNDVSVRHCRWKAPVRCLPEADLFSLNLLLSLMTRFHSLHSSFPVRNSECPRVGLPYRLCFIVLARNKIIKEYEIACLLLGYCTLRRLTLCLQQDVELSLLIRHGFCTAYKAIDLIKKTIGYKLSFAYLKT